MTHGHVFIQAPRGNLEGLKVSWRARKPSLKLQSVQNNNKNTGSALIMFNLIFKLHFATSSTGGPSSIKYTLGDYNHNNMLQDAPATF